jgi:hypothetical protein
LSLAAVTMPFDMLQKPTADTRFCTAGAQTSSSKTGLFKIHVCLLINKYRGL